MHWWLKHKDELVVLHNCEMSARITTSAGQESVQEVNWCGGGGNYGTFGAYLLLLAPGHVKCQDSENNMFIR